MPCIDNGTINTCGAGVDDLYAQIAALQSGVESIATVFNGVDLPDPSTLPDGTVRIVREADLFGLPALVVVKDNQWVPAFPAIPTISFVADLSTPEDVVVGVGATVPLGTGWSLLAPNTITRPLSILAAALDPADIHLGSAATGIYRTVVEVNFDLPAPAAAYEVTHVLQVDTGGGFADVTPELMRIDQAALEATAGLTQVGVDVNRALTGGNHLRVAVKHDSGSSKTITYNGLVVAINQFLGFKT